MNILTIYKHLYIYAIPGPTPEQLKQYELEWKLRIAIANFWGISNADILTQAKKDYLESVKAQIGAGCSGSETWEKDCKDSRKAYFISEQLPELDTLTSSGYSKKKVLIASLKQNG